MRVEVRTQAEMEAAIAAGNLPLCIGTRFVLSAGMSVEARGNSSVVAWGNSSVVARENSSVVAWGNSSVVARGNSSVVAWGNSSVVARGNSSVEARGNSSVEARGAAIVRVFACFSVVASAMVTVVIHGCDAKISGGIQVKIKQPTTAREWCEFYGAEIVEEDECAILFKGLDENFKSPHGGDYTPGTVPECADWDGGQRECGGGFHFSPHPAMTLEFNPGAKKFAACPVRLSEIIVHQDAEYPQKVKAPRCCAATWEVDRKGKRIASPVATADAN